MTVRFDPFIEQLRKRRGTIPADLYAQMIAAWEAAAAGGQSPATPATTAAGEPAWLLLARAQMGTKEVPGTQHNSRIVDWFSKVGAGWFTDDETPWCGAFVGAMLKLSGVEIVDKGLAVRAKEWAAWGKPTQPRVGAIAVFGREGGGHVGFVVGESATNLYVLGGNQSNAVNIMPLAKSRLIAMRWPAALPLSDAKLPAMTGGVVSTNER
jgi:uncharacterized protein (TIGR02594 family)